MSPAGQADHERLTDYFRQFPAVIVAFSGGIDSSVLVMAAFKALGVKAVAVTCESPTSDPSESACASQLAGMFGFPHVILSRDELECEEFRRNPVDRCYFCKKQLSDKLIEYAGGNGVKVIVEGTNSDELAGHRPGFAALQEVGIRSPLAELGIGKDGVRAIGRLLGLPNAEKPSTACLASRIPYGQEITSSVLARVGEAESFLRSEGFGQLRVRCFEDIAVIEVLPEDFDRVLDKREEIVGRLSELGFERISLDLAGFRSGSMNQS
ncbi:ATP-dependent sacrificial sulfur transferase LarE [Candidatus Altiarchaeota archaeon]